MRSIKSLVAVLALWPLSVRALPIADVPLTERTQFEALCGDLVPIERMQFGTSDPLRAQEERDAYVQRQQARRAERYTLELSWSDFFVSGATSPNAPDGALDLLLDRPFSLFKGSVTLFDLDRDRLLFVPIAEEGAQADLRAGLQKGTLRLVLHFRVAAEEPAPCSKSKLGNLALSVDLLRAELLESGRTVATARGDGIEGPLRTGAPTLTLRAVRREDPGPVSALIDGLAPQRPALERCYAQSLSATPGIEGMIAYELSSNAEGRLETSIAVADSLLSPMLESCATAVLKGAKVPPDLHGTIVLEFSLKPTALDKAR